MIEELKAANIYDAIAAARNLPLRIVWTGRDAEDRHNPIHMSPRDITKAASERLLNQFNQIQSIEYFQYDATENGWELSLLPLKERLTSEWKPLSPEGLLRHLGVTV